MEYTVHELAALAGVSVRTLHWYDEIGLLHPQRTTQAGYRLYGAAEVDRLQTILFYRALGVPCKRVAQLMTAPAFDRLEALQSHRTALQQERRRLDALLQTLEKTILTEQGELAMTDKEKFEGFKQKLIAENEAAYGKEARGKYGDDAVNDANEKLQGLTPAQYTAMTELGAQINAALAKAVQNGENPAGAQGQRIAAQHKEWLCYTWKTYTKAAHRGVAQMYTADPRFTAYYDETVPGCAQFLCDAVLTYTA